MKRKSIIVIIILLIIGVAVAIATIFNKELKNANTNTKTGAVEETTLPKVRVYYGNQKICDLNGYTMEMDLNHIRDTIVPVAKDRKIPVKIKSGDNKIQSIAYSVFNMEDNRLIDSGSVEKWDEEKGEISFSYNVSAILEYRKEYIMQITVATDKHSYIEYDTRAMVMEKDFIPDQIKFAKDFSDNIYNHKSSINLSSYLETNPDLPDDYFGQVNLSTTYAALTWKEMKPSKTTKTAVTTKEFCIKDSGEAGTYTLTYQIKATNAQKVEETYNVAETITVWTFSGQQYILAYDREVNQVWEANENNVGNAFIDLGIQNINDIAHIESENGEYVAFAINSDVYIMNISKKEIRPIFQMNAGNSKTLYQTRARVIEVDNAGNVDFMIYGYSPTNQHVGENGIFIMKYSYKSNKAEETAFIPTKEMADVLETQLSTLCYVGDGTLYIMLDNSIYYVNLETKEWGTLVAKLEEGSYAVNEQGTVLAYNTNGTKDSSESITIVDLTNGNKKTIEAHKGNYITVFGYTGTNLVYGYGLKDKGSYLFLPVYQLVIMNDKFEEIKSYQKKKVYISDVEITDTIISMKRWKKGKKISDDQLLDNTEDKASVAKSSYFMDDMKQRELAIAFTNNLDASTKLTVGDAADVVFNHDAEVKPTFEKNEEEKLYVYGYGRLQTICYNRKDAIAIARKNCGLVTDETGKKIWVFEENYNS